MAPSVLPIWWCLLCLGALPAFDTATTLDNNAFVKAHNRLRQTAVPAVANMHFMTWDSALETKAKAAAAKEKGCPKKLDEVKELTANEAANLYWGDSLDAVAITNEWIRCKDMHENIMRATNDAIGCAIYEHCTPRIVICVYKKPTGAKEIGWPCLKCPPSYECFGGLCISSAQKGDAAYKNLLLSSLDNPVTAASLKHDLTGCPVCDATGTKPDASSNKIPTKDPLTSKCSCTCLDGGTHVGTLCQVKKTEFEASVRLKLVSTVDPKNSILPPVSQSLFTEKILTELKTKLNEKAKTLCNVQSSYEKCCPGGTHGKRKAAKDYANFFIIDGSIGNDCDGALYLNVYGIPLKVAATDRYCDNTPDVVPRATMDEIIPEVITALSADLSSAKLTLAKVTPEPTVEVATDYSKACPTTKPACTAPTTTTPKPDDTTDKTTKKPTGPNNSVPSNPGKPGNTGAPPPAKDKLASRTATASLALMLISCICTVALLCVQSMAF